MTLTPSQLETVRKMGFKGSLYLHTIHKVTQWKRGAVYATQFVGFILCNREYRLNSDQFIIGNIPTDMTRQLLK